MNNDYNRYLSGDDDGLCNIIKDYKDGLIMYLNNYVSDLTVAEELAEDTFVKLAVKKPKFKGKSSFKTWLYAIGRNCALDFLRKNKSWISFEALGDISEYEQEYIKIESKIAVRKALSIIKPQYRQALWLAYFEGFDTKQAAKVMNKSVHATETLLYRARQELKNILIKEGITYEDL